MPSTADVVATSKSSCSLTRGGPTSRSPPPPPPAARPSSATASRSPVERHRKRFDREGLEAALTDKPRSGAPAKLDGKQEAAIVALACSDAPQGQARWTAKLLANRAVELEVVESISESSVRRLLKKTRSSRGRSGRGASRR